MDIYKGCILSLQFIFTLKKLKRVIKRDPPAVITSNLVLVRAKKLFAFVSMSFCKFLVLYHCYELIVSPHLQMLHFLSYLEKSYFKTPQATLSSISFEKL